MERVRLGQTGGFRGLTYCLKGWKNVDTKREWLLKGKGRRWKASPRPSCFAAKAGYFREPRHPASATASWKLPVKWLICSGSQFIIFQWKSPLWLLLISKTLLYLNVFNACHPLSAHYLWENHTLFYHNHHLPPACLTWTHYSHHPSPRRSLLPSPRVQMPALWKINLLYV